MQHSATQENDATLWSTPHEARARTQSEKEQRRVWWHRHMTLPYDVTGNKTKYATLCSTRK